MQTEKYSGELVLTPLELIDRLAQLAPPSQVVVGFPMVVPPGCAAPTESPPKPWPPMHYLWAALIARIYGVFPLICPMCGGQMRIIALITKWLT